MTNRIERLIETIEQSIANLNKARVYFKQYRTPMFGKFVKLTDYKEKLGKGMVRFVNEGEVDSFDADGHVMHSRLFTIESFEKIQLF